ncbi:hypothetical protein RchiOBHm_Chr3g0480291 [Rosa chinensis]|uniref:Uncharacterized protein n=1 Tax=Rosa chinensis TaxID=74649 RepID=A0A2P6RDN2_ROSCH|nr:hypothetical protein RchiOBHm_Chr3g0480291 [Rosa chinensis]
MFRMLIVISLLVGFEVQMRSDYIVLIWTEQSNSHLPFKRQTSSNSSRYARFVSATLFLLLIFLCISLFL